MTTPGFRPTHVVPQHGMPAWEAPDPSRPTVDLDPLLPVQLMERQGDWGHVLCFNGWSAWVDGRRLVAVPQDPPAADGPLTRAADPRPLLGRAQEALARYRSAVEDLAGGLDREAFRTRTRGMRIGVVVDGESVWLYDSAHEHWVYADGTRMTTYATDDTPAARPASRPAEPPVHPPTRVAPPQGPVGTPRAEKTAHPPGAPASAQGAPAGPTRTPPPETPEPSGVAPAEAPEPTRVVAPEASEPARVAREETPEASRGAPAEAAEPTRVAASEASEPSGVVSAEAAEPTRVVAPGASEPARVAPPEAAHQPTRVAPPGAPEPARVVSAGAAEPTRVVSSAEWEGEDAEDRPAAAPPTRAVGQEPTRVVSPEGDGR